jgi:hypothetical protein
MKVCVIDVFIFYHLSYDVTRFTNSRLKIYDFVIEVMSILVFSTGSKCFQVHLIWQQCGLVFALLERLAMIQEFRKQHK